MMRWQKRVLLFVLLFSLLGGAGSLGPTASEARTITLEAIQHDTHDKLYRYPFGAAQTGEEVRLRIRAKAGELDKAVISYWDETAGFRFQKEMERIGESPDGIYEYWEALLKSDTPTVIWYHFILSAGGETVYYGDPGQDGGLGRAVRTNPTDFQLTIYDKNFKTPDWMKNAITYQIFPDRFYDGDPGNNRAAEERGFRGNEPIEYRQWGQLPDNPREKGVNPAYDGDGIWNNDFFGGDLAGVTAKLDYLQELGIKAIYLNPIFESVSNHKYDPADYESIDRMFGSNEDFLKLADEAKRRGIHLILDGVFNHVSDDSRYFDRYGKWPDLGAYEAWLQGRREESPYAEWFVIRPDGRYEGWGGLDSMPLIASPGGSELNVSSFADYIIRNDDSISRRWVKAGSSGWRLDVSTDVAHDFWVAFREHLKGPKGLSSFPNGEPIMLAENWFDATKDLLGDAFDSTMNYRFLKAVTDFILNVDAKTFDAALTEIYEDYPKEAFYVMMNLLDSHDTIRVKKLFGDIELGLFADQERARGKTPEEIAAVNELAKSRLKLAALFQMGYPGSPTIYYGDEVGLTGYKDPDCRRTFPWEKVTPDNDLLNHYKKAAKIRNENQVLKTGDLVTLYAQGGTYAIGRKLLGDRDALGREEYITNYHTGERLRIADHNAIAIVVISKSGEENLQLNLEGFVRDGAIFTDMLNDGLEYVVRNGSLSLSIPPMWGAILIARHGEQDLLPPPPPTGLVATEGDRRVELRWGAVEDAASYNVYRTTIIGGHYERIARGLTETSFIDLGVENLKRYFYTVTALDAAGNESAMSEHVVAVPSIPISKITIRYFGLTDAPGATGEHTIGVENEIEPLYVTVYVPGVTEGPGQGAGVLAQFGFGQEPDPAEWTWVPARYVGDRDEADEYAGSFIPDRLGRWFISMRFSTNLGMSWRLATYEDGTFPSFTVVPSSDLTPPPVPSLAEPQVLHRLEAPSFVVLNWSLPTLTDVHHIDILRQRGEGWERIAALPATAKSYTDQEVVHGRTYSYQVMAVDSSFNRSESNIVSVIPRPLALKQEAPTLATLSEVKPTIDGKVGEGEWNGAVNFAGDGLLERFFIGYGTYHLFLRADAKTPPKEWIGKEYRLVLYIGFHTKAEPGTPINGLTRFAKVDIGFPLTQLVQLRFEHLRPDGSGNVFRYVADGMEGWEFASQIQLLMHRIVRVGDVMEVQIPLAELGLDRSEDLMIWMRLTLEREGEMLGTAPTQPLIARIPALVGGKVIASLSDPKGDDHGPGTYTYPTNPVFAVEGIFDLLNYTIFDQGANWLLAFEFAALPNPWNAPFGFSHPIINLYLDTQAGGLTEAHPEGDAMQIRLHPDHPWDFFVKVAGWPGYGRHLFTSDGKEHLIEVSSEPAKRLVLVRISKEVVPQICGAHYVMVASQDGYADDHIRPIGQTASEWVGGGSPAPTVAPKVYDYLAPAGHTQEEILSSYNVETRGFATLIPVIIECK